MGRCRVALPDGTGAGAAVERSHGAAVAAAAPVDEVWNFRKHTETSWGTRATLADTLAHTKTEPRKKLLLHILGHNGYEPPHGTLRRP